MNLAVNKMKRNQKFNPDADARLMNQVKEVLRYHHYAYRTEKIYCDWIVRYLKSVGRLTDFTAQYNYPWGYFQPRAPFTK